MRVITVAPNDELFFKIVEHYLTVVEVGATYTKSFKIDTLFLDLGQTTTALLIAGRGIDKYSIVVSPLMDIIVSVDTLTGTTYLSYNHTLPFIPTTMTTMPPINATWMTSIFIESIRSLNSKEYPPANVPLTVDHSLFFIVGVGINPCFICSNGSRDVAAINSVTFDMPTTTLEAHYYGIKKGFYK